jgi:hypothetical protein
MPISLVNPVSLRLFNSAYFRRIVVQRVGSKHFRAFLLSSRSRPGWNHLYGPHGFYQYQCVLPRGCQAAATQELLRLIRNSGSAPSLPC